MENYHAAYQKYLKVLSDLLHVEMHGYMYLYMLR